jgi:hypothetical protein
MGVNKNKLYFLKKFSSIDFIVTQGFWGHKKDKCNNILNSHILGFINDCTVFKSDFFLEYLSRYFIFCADIIANKGNVIFILPFIYDDIVITPNFSTKEFIIYFCLRSLQPFYSYQEVNFKLLNYTGKKRSFIFIIPHVAEVKEIIFLKQLLSRSMPFIHIEDSNFNLDRGIHFIAGNNNSIQYIFFCYRILSYSILRSMFLSYCKNLMR